MPLYRGSGGAGDASTDAYASQISQYAQTAITKANEAAISAAEAAADLVLTNADVVLTHADVVLTHADVVLTNADAVSTALDVVATNADAVATALDVVATNADAASTALDVIATNADAVATALDVVATNADVVASALSETNAASSASTATTQASNASTSAINAALSETNSSTFATNSLTYAGDSAAARDQSQAARDTANLHKLAAEAAATSATNTAAALIGFDLEAIAATKAVTAVDVFVYDTSLDSDGGAWRKRTQGTSWYNETLNTATRGSRKEFPAVAVIVAEAAKVTIYDGDDPSLPMWMVLNQTNAGPVELWRLGRNATSLSCFNGDVCIGTSLDSNGGLLVLDFVADRTSRRSALSNYGFGTILNRNSGAQLPVASADPLVNFAVNDVAMTVLPDAPIDPATGLPVPTIAVATAGGVSVIKDDGTVVDITNSSTNDYSYAVSFGDKNFLNLQQGGAGPGVGWLYVFDEIPAADTVITNNTKTGSTASPIAYYAKSTLGSDLDLLGDPDHGREGNYIGTDAAIVALAENPDAPTKGMVAYTTSTYNTGWMPGDIKGAFLADTDDTDLVGSGELVTNGDDFTGVVNGTSTLPDGASNVGWYATSDGTYSVTDGVLTITNGTNGRTGFYFPIATVVGASYCVDIRGLNHGNSGPTAMNIRGTDTINPADTSPFLVSAAGDSIVTFIATTTTTYISITNYSLTSGVYGSVDSISVVRADADRSINNKGLIVNGTVTRTPVATGAELVAYSGFSASNYLEQPYNSALDFGTGDFSIMGWVTASASSHVPLSRQSGSVSTSGFWLYQSGGSSLTGELRFRSVEGAASTETIVGTITNQLTHFVVARQSGVTRTYINGVFQNSSTDTRNVTNTSAVLKIGIRADSVQPWLNGKAALIRISATAPTASQIEKIYNDEKLLFQDNAACTIYGASDAVTALAHDPVTDLLHVGTSAGRSVFSGLRRVSNTTTAVGTAISASNGLVVEE